MNTWLQYLIGIGVLYILANLNLKYLIPVPDTNDLAPYAGIFLIVNIFLGRFIAILIHELGHLLAGMVGGFRFEAINVDGIMVYRDLHRGNKLKIGFRRPPAGASGTVSMLPVNIADENLRALYLQFILGGPIGSFVGFVLLSIITNFIWTSSQDSVSGSSWLRSLCAMSALMSLAGALHNLFSSKSSPSPSDGFQLQNIHKNTPVGQRILGLAYLIGMGRWGYRARDWNSEWVKKVIEVQDQSKLEAQANYLAYDWTLDCGNTDLAQNHLERTLELVDHLPDDLQNSVRLAEAYFFAVHRNDSKRARLAFEKTIETPEIPIYYRLRSEAAIHLAEQDLEGAMLLAQKGLSMYEADGRPNFAQEEHDQLRDILDRAKQKLAMNSM